MRTLKKYLVLAVSIFVIVLAGYVGVGYATKHDVSAKIVKTERVQDTYMVYTDKGAFKLKDDFRFLNFRSGDWYGKLSSHIGQPVTLTVTGFRVPLFSMFQNIVGVDYGNAPKNSQ